MKRRPHWTDDLIEAVSDATEIIWSEDMIFPDDGPPARVMVCRGEARAL